MTAVEMLGASDWKTAPAQITSVRWENRHERMGFRRRREIRYVFLVDGVRYSGGTPAIGIQSGRIGYEAALQSQTTVTAIYDPQVPGKSALEIGDTPIGPAWLLGTVAIVGLAAYLLWPLRRDCQESAGCS